MIGEKHELKVEGYLSICLSVCLSVYLSIHPSNHSSIYRSVHVGLFVCMSLCVPKHLSVCMVACSSARPSIRPFILFILSYPILSCLMYRPFLTDADFFSGQRTSCGLDFTCMYRQRLIVVFFARLHYGCISDISINTKKCSRRPKFSPLAMTYTYYALCTFTTSKILRQ